MSEVKELATKLGEVVLTGRGKRISVGGKFGLLSDKELQALARVALEYVEEQEGQYVKPTPIDSIPEGAEVGIIEGDIFSNGKKREEPK